MALGSPRSWDGPILRKTREPIDTTPAPWSPLWDGMRHSVPGPWRYFLDDQEITKEEFERLWEENRA